jgi:hypothetical protein
MNKPIKRNESLKSLSREHHHGLLLCWKIRTGIKKGVAVSRIKAYLDWFYHTHLIPHFEVEERHVYTIPGLDAALIDQALSEHRRLRQLFESATVDQTHLCLIETALEQHIRFEERVLFNAIQEQATPAQLQSVVRAHAAAMFADNLTDPFWL